MGVLDVPKAVYKAQQAKKKMSKIQAAGKEGAVGILLNGINEIVEIEVDVQTLMEEFGITEEQAQKIANALAKQMQGAFKAAGDNLRKELMNSTSLEDLKGMLG